MARTKTGVYTLTNMLLALCTAITKFTPVLMLVSSNNVALSLALSATMDACEALRLALEPYRNPEY